MAFVAGQKLRVSDLDGGTGGGSGSTAGGGVSRASADVTVNNTTTFTDTGLQLSVVANAVYAVRAWIRYNTGNTPDIKFQWSTPSGTTGYWSLVGHGRDVTTAAVDVSAGATFVVEDIGTSKTVAGDATGTLLLACVAGGELTTTTAGTVKLRVAQRTANASNTVFRTGSRMELVRIA